MINEHAIFWMNSEQGWQSHVVYDWELETRSEEIDLTSSTSWFSMVPTRLQIQAMDFGPGHLSG